jgi:NAD(P)H-hydrate epimerase
VLTAEQMRRFDRWAISELGIPSLVLMENAALGVVDAIGERYAPCDEVLVLCGPGNNGGDGLAVARHLVARGYSCTTWLAASRSRLGGDAAAQLAILDRLGIPVHEMSAGDYSALPPAGLLVDALFGTGLERPLAGDYAALAAAIAEHAAPVIAVDLPSGLDASRGEPIGPHVVADLTVTFARPKLTHVLDPAAAAVGELVVADLGVPWTDLDHKGPSCSLLVGEELGSWLPERRADSHKGDFGHLLIVAGSAGMSGAAVLAARAAVRAGAGLVSLAVPESIRGECHVGCLEAMTVSLGDAGDRAFSREHVEALRGAAASRSALAVGPGVGGSDDALAAVRELVHGTYVPLVLDADGLNAFAGRIDELAGRAGELVLTPHPGELARLLGSSVAAVQSDRISAAREAAARARAVVVLKGHQSLVAEPDGELAINPTGNPGLASGGSGDVLTGVIGSLLAQAFETSAAARLGVYVHGLAGDLAAARLGERSLGASDLVAELSRAFLELERRAG